MGIYSELFSRLETRGYPDGLHPWQSDVLGQVEAQSNDVAIELPTGAGKTLVALLIAQRFLEESGGSVVYLTGTKHLTRQVVNEAHGLGVAAHPFHDGKGGWDGDHITDVEFGSAIGVMNFYNYFNEAPGIGPADLLVLDDVHLAEGPLRGYFTVEIPRGDALFADVLLRIRGVAPYYSLVNDLVDDVAPVLPTEMLTPLDVLDIAPAVAPLLHSRLTEGSDAWWAWRHIQNNAAACCWLVSPRGLTITPWIPPSQQLVTKAGRPFADPTRRIYLSATIGDPGDLRRRIGCGKFKKLRSDVPPRQGRRVVVLASGERTPTAHECVASLADLLSSRPKALWLAARRATADQLMDELDLRADGPVWRLKDAGTEADSFSSAETGHLVASGRYDGMDFPGDACRLEVIPEAPIGSVRGSV